MKKKILALLLLGVMLLTQGCTVARALTMPKDPIVFESGIVEDSEKNSYYKIIWNGREYLPYAHFTDYYANYIEACLGYLDTGVAMKDSEFVYTLVGEDKEEYLATIHTMTHGIPKIYKAVDGTKDLSITCTEVNGYSFWENK